MSIRNFKPSRRDFLKGSGALIVSSALPAGAAGQAVSALAADVSAGPWPPVDLAQLDSWLAVKGDGSVVAFAGKVEMGMGVQTAFGQIVAEELDVPFEKVQLVMGDTAITPDQGGTGSSNGISSGANPVRNAAAEARRVLVDLAAKRLGVPAAQLAVKDGVVSLKTDASKNVSYAQLIGDARFNVSLSGTGQNVVGQAKPKTPAQYSIVGQPIKRVDIPAKATGRFSWIGDVRVPGMLHGRMIRPPQFGATLQSVAQPKGVAGLVKVVSQGNFLGVVAETEWNAIQAIAVIKPSWSTPTPAFPAMDKLYDYMRGLKPQSGSVTTNIGNVDAALAGAARVIQASYNWPFQSHAMMGPACAVADVRSASATVWSGTQKPYALRAAIADLLGFKVENVRVIWVEGSGSYGRGSMDDAAADAALLSQAVGKPVRVQWMRADEVAWDPKGPPVVMDVRAGLDDKGNVIAYDWVAKDFSGSGIPASSTKAGNMLAGQLIGKPAGGTDEAAALQEAYGFLNKRKAAYVLPWPQDASPLRTAHLRAPEQLSTTFGGESFIDEVAAAVGADPVAFRLRYLTDARDAAAIQAAAKRYGWDTRPSPQKPPAGPSTVKGRGIAYAPRSGTHVALVAEVEVNRQTGQVRPLYYVMAHDAGLIVNPDGMEGVIQANLIQATGRALHEEVQFNTSMVTSVDWKTYPVLMAPEVPDKVEIELINHPEIAPAGAGEPASVVVAAALANAIYDATGARLRTVPFTPERVLAALKTV